MNKYKTLLTLTCFCVLSSCSSWQQVSNSKMSLVGAQQLDISNVATSDVSVQLSNIQQGDTVKVGNDSFVVNKKYFSALGLECVKISHQKLSEKTYCFYQNTWFQASEVSPS